MTGHDNEPILLPQAVLMFGVFQETETVMRPAPPPTSADFASLRLGYGRSGSRDRGMRRAP